MVRNEEKTLFRFSKNPHASYDIYRYIVVSFASSPVVPCNWYSAMMDAPTGAVVGPSLDAPRRRLQPGDLLVVPLQGQAWPAMIQVGAVRAARWNHVSRALVQRRTTGRG